MGYARSPFPDFKSYLRILSGWDEKNTQLILKQNISGYITDEILSSSYPSKDFLKLVNTIGNNEGTPKIEYDNISRKTKPILTRFGLTFGMFLVDEISLIYILIGFTHFWDYKPTNATQVDSPGVYTSEKLIESSTKDKIQLKCDVIEGSVVNGPRQPIL